ncbi:Acetyl esterase/lipase [Lachnospiraceae bacterium NE2001]|nr:Acetyl esterase/lipase [Lachnospiraceae bacterium NE2001]
MAIAVRVASSKEMKKNKNMVKLLTKGREFDENMLTIDWSKARIAPNLGYTFLPREKGVKGYRVPIAGTVSELLLPEDVDDSAVILYIHGGGFVSGSASASRSYCSMLAAYTGFRVISAEYRLSPENQFPDGLEDCYNILRVIRKKYPDSKVVLGGESAGGNMCLALALKARDRGRRSIAAVIAHSPLVDFTGALDRTQHEIDDFTVREGFIEPMRIAYAGDANPTNPYISPFYGDYKDMPPIFLTCDYNETLFADSMAIYRKCRAAETPVKMVQMKEAFHAFATMGTRTPETEKLLRENASFIMKYLYQPDNKTN